MRRADRSRTGEALEQARAGGAVAEAGSEGDSAGAVFDGPMARSREARPSPTQTPW
ncbi:hypothetical protein [Streptomyces sp. JV178]|uniref:hypothetical protein n=1 Tax=Streptomyces sp. JV178 TaxID=858632 RepID=UPI0015D53949|nr:hypothetical protein [Streptomyces sp. JV178]